jgi:histidinol phosphatase-like enzyme
MNNNIDNGDDISPPTLFLDIDGTLVKFPYSEKSYKSIANGTEKMEVLPGVREKLWKWETKGYKIILTTGRREMFRDETIKALKEAGIGFDQLVMNCGSGPRYVINDRKPGLKNGKIDTAFGINVDRDEGFTHFDI